MARQISFGDIQIKSYICSSVQFNSVGKTIGLLKNSCEEVVYGILNCYLLIRIK